MTDRTLTEVAGDSSFFTLSELYKVDQLEQTAEESGRTHERPRRESDELDIDDSDLREVIRGQ